MKIHKKKWLKIVGIVLPTFVVLSILFINTSPIRDNPPPGSIQLARGGNAMEVWQNGDTVYKIYESPELRNQFVYLHNRFAMQMPELIPPYQAWGTSSVTQQFVGGYAFDSLSPQAKEVANTQMNNFLMRSGNSAGLAWAEKSGGNAGLTYLLENGNYARIDISNIDVNTKFDINGNILKVFDPIYIGDVHYLHNDKLVGAVNVKTGLPIDNGESLKIAMDPTETGANGLRVVRSYTLLNSVMAIGEIALTTNDYRNQYNAATTDEQKSAAHHNYLRSIGLILGFTVVGVVVIAGLTILNPLVAATLAIGFVGIGGFGFGSHISASFNNDILNLWDRMAGRPLAKADSNHPQYAKLQKYQSQQLQVQLKRHANEEGRSVVEFRDIARAAIIKDPSYRQVFYSNPGTASQAFRNGYFLSDARVKEFAAFRSMVNVYHDFHYTGKTSDNWTQDDFRSWIKELNAIPAIDLNNFQKTTGAPINYPNTFAKLVDLNMSQGPLKKFNGAPGMGTISMQSIGSLNLSHAPLPAGATPGTLVAPIIGVSPNYSLTPFAFDGTSQQLENLIDDPNMLKRFGGLTIPVGTGSVTIRPLENAGDFYCYDSPKDIIFLGNGVTVERDHLTGDNEIVFSQVIVPKAGGSSYSSFGMREVTSNGTYEVNGGMQSCSTQWVPGCGVSTAIPWTPTTGTGGTGNPTWCTADRFTPGCPCFYNPWLPQCM